MNPRYLALAAMSTLALSGCATPKVVSYYDEKCQLMSRRMELDFVKMEALSGCSNQGCVAQALGGAAVFAASTVISGTVVVVGNVAYWMERSANCKPKAATEA